MNDSSDSQITFDAEGHCSYCNDALAIRDTTYFPNAEGEKRLEQLLDSVKASGKSKQYDCVMGLSGGLDSSYLAYLAAEKWGLRIAAVHIDDGYDTEISKMNIEQLCKTSGIDLVRIEPDSTQFNDLTKAYMKAGVPNIAIPQDNVLLAYIYDFSKKNGLNYFLSGGNYALECILQKGNTWSNTDVVNIMDIHKRFGTEPIDKLKFISKRNIIFNQKLLNLQSPRPLNYIDYNRDRAFKELNDYCGYEYYGRKHLENYLTAFVQLHWLPKKFGVDKRTSHLSSMIISGQMTRQEALQELKEPLVDEKYLENLFGIICSNMKLDRTELDELVSAPSHQHDDYKVNHFKI